MATNAGAGAARQLQSARTATAVWKVSSCVHHGQYSAEPSRSTLFSHRYILTVLYLYNLDKSHRMLRSLGQLSTLYVLDE